MDKTKKKKYLLIIPVILIAALVFYMGGERDAGISLSGIESSEMEPAEADPDAQKQDGKDLTREGKKESGDTAEEKAGTAGIYVDVGGAVISPQVVSIPEGSRVFQAIEAAGGQREDAEVKNLNLAEICTDGQKIYVPTAEEVAEAQNAGVAPAASLTSPAADNAGVSGTSSGNASGTGNAENGTGAPVNINTAGLEELQTLNGVGPGIAQKIIDYRTANGNFNSIDELQNVSGIGAKIMEKLRDHITV